MHRMSSRFSMAAAVLAALAATAAQSAAARTGCDSYGRCFEFSGPSDRLADRESLWRRADADAPSAQAPDPLALAHGTVGDLLDDPAGDD